MHKNRSHFGLVPRSDPQRPSTFGTHGGIDDGRRRPAGASDTDGGLPDGWLSPWDPIFALASDLRAAFMEPLKGKIFEAFGVLTELSGKHVDREDSLAVDAFSFTLLDMLSRDAGMAEERRDTLMQLIAAQIFHSPANPAIKNSESFWTFLNTLAVAYRAPVATAMPLPRLHALIDRFLSHYNLNGEENADVIAGMDRILAPLLLDVRRIMGGRRSAAGLS